jgi:flagellar biosynthesis protein FlhF
MAHRLAEDAEKSGLPSPLLALSSALDKRMTPAPVDFAQAEAVLLIGPYGAGKTSIAAKLAAAAKAAQRAVRFIATDVESAGQLARLEIFAEHLGIETVAAPDPESFVQTVAESRKDGVLAIADSAGCDPRRPAQSILDLARSGGADIIGVVSAANDAQDARDIAVALKDIGAKHLVVTCLDLAQRKGALAMLAISGLPIAHTASSPYLVAGLDSPTPLSLARSLLSSIDDQASEVLG